MIEKTPGKGLRANYWTLITLFVNNYYNKNYSDYAENNLFILCLYQFF